MRNIIFRKLFLILLAISFAVSCGSPAKNEQNVPDESAVDREQARQLSDKVVEDFKNRSYAALRADTETSFREANSEDQFRQMVNKMDFAFGKLTEAEFKFDEYSFEVDAKKQKRPMRKFWYAVKTAKHEKGTHFFFVNVVRDADRLAASEFSIVNFPQGVPPQLK